MGASSYALVASALDDGVQLTDITNPASPLPVASITDEVDGFNELDGAFDIITVAIDTSLYAIVISENDDGVQIIGF
ncbi:MAG: hypothetical protein ACOC8L_13080 [Spirochaetota bacterium]